MINKLIAMVVLSLGLSATGAMAAAPMAPIDSSAYKAPVRVACVGDSITQGIGAEKGKSYPSQLQELLGDSWKIGNFGVSGRTLLKKGDHPYWNEKAYQNALGFKPDVVIIMLGTNDTKPPNWKHEAEFVADYKELVNSFLALESKPRVYVCRPCPVPGAGNYGINEICVKEEILRLDALAAEMKLGIIDMHAALADDPKLLPDRVHPNTAGAGEMARAAFAALTGKAPAVKAVP
jgi:lysophospholipase L1-like esterase